MSINTLTYLLTYLLVINSNLGPISPHFSDITGFLLKTAPTPIPSEFWVFFPWTRFPFKIFFCYLFSMSSHSSTTFSRHMEAFDALMFIVSSFRDQAFLVSDLVSEADWSQYKYSFGRHSFWPLGCFIFMLSSVFTAYIMLFISDNCRLHV